MEFGDSVGQYQSPIFVCPKGSEKYPFISNTSYEEQTEESGKNDSLNWGLILGITIPFAALVCGGVFLAWWLLLRKPQLERAKAAQCEVRSAM